MPERLPGEMRPQTLTGKGTITKTRDSCATTTTTSAAANNNDDDDDEERTLSTVCCFSSPRRLRICNVDRGTDGFPTGYCP